MQIIVEFLQSKLSIQFVHFTRKMFRIKIGSSDGKVYEIDIELTDFSETLSKILLDYERDIDDVWSVPIEGNVLEKVIEWVIAHKDDPEPRWKRTETMSEWDEQFLETNEWMLFKLGSAASFLEAEGLLSTVTQHLIKKLEPVDIQLN